MFSFRTKIGGSMSFGNLEQAIKRAEREGKPEIFSGSHPVAWPMWQKGSDALPYYVPGAKYLGYKYDPNYIKGGENSEQKNKREN